jgi:CheY-like chemotaxis protein
MSPEPFNILLCDDDSDDWYFFNEALEKISLSTNLTAVHDGEQLMQLLTNKKNELPHVLFLDLNMPRKNGFECLKEIKHNEKLKQLPVIIFSTSFDKEVANQLYKNGAQYFIRKPSEIPQLQKVILQALTLLSKESVSQPDRIDFVLTA